MAGQEDEFDEQALRQQLEAVAGVEVAVVDGARGRVWLILRAGAEPHVVLEAARPLAAPRDVEIVFRPEYRDRQRVRFVAVHRDLRPDQQSEIRVVLEWCGAEYRGAATGDSRGAAELRTAALAALDAVAAVVPGEIEVRLAGIKQVRAFDEDLIMVSLYRPGGAPRNLVGVVVAGSDPRRAAAVAVLNALNRLLGNYLQLP